MSKIKKMYWDSDFWGLDIYSVKKIENSQEFNNSLLKVKKNKPYIVQTLLAINEIEYINFIEEIGFKLIETKVTLVKKISYNTNSIREHSYRKVKVNELEKHKKCFYQLYSKNSRFSFMPKEKLNDFYYKWAIESVKGKLDDYCIGFYEDENLKGFITYKVNNETIIIGLLGVFPEFQGNGVSQKLLRFIDVIAVENNCKYIYVSTQGGNLNALNAYIKSSYFVNEIKHWFYLKGGF